MHPEALSDKGREVFERLGNFRGFYLAGGTALALQLGHRLSLDFDLFNDKELDENLLEDAKRVFPEKNLTIAVNNKDELSVLINDIKLTFLHYPFPRLLALVEYERLGLLHYKEIAATKAYTIGRRGSFKDYVDIYFVLMERGTGLAEIMELGQKKYRGEFNSRLFLEQLIYLDDIADEKIFFLKKPVTKEELEEFFKKAVGDIKL